MCMLLLSIIAYCILKKISAENAFINHDTVKVVSTQRVQTSAKADVNDYPILGFPTVIFRTVNLSQQLIPLYIQGD